MSGAPTDIVQQLTARGVEHIYVDGGITIQRFLQARLVQRMIITRVPVLIGAGIPLFGAVPHDIALTPVWTRQYASGLVQTEYVVAAQAMMRPMESRESEFSDSRLRLIAAVGLVTGAVLGIAGTFAPSASLRALAWGVDGTALVVASALLAVHHCRRGNILAAAGFLVFLAGEALVLSGTAMTLEASVPSFAAGISLWAASLALVGASNTMPLWLRVVGFVGALLFAVVAVRIFLGAELTPLSEPLPFFAYPLLAATLFGWAWVHYRGDA